MVVLVCDFRWLFYFATLGSCKNTLQRINYLFIVQYFLLPLDLMIGHILAPYRLGFDEMSVHHNIMKIQPEIKLNCMSASREKSKSPKVRHHHPLGI